MELEDAGGHQVWLAPQPPITPHELRVVGIDQRVVLVADLSHCCRKCKAEVGRLLLQTAVERLRKYRPGCFGFVRWRKE